MTAQTGRGPGRGGGGGFQYGDTHFNTGETPVDVAAFVREYDGTDR